MSILTCVIGALKSHGASRERRLAVAMGRPPFPCMEMDPAMPVEEFVSGLGGDLACLIFDPAFWYPAEAWRAWFNAVESGPGDPMCLDVPAGNQDKAWSSKIPLLPYATLRGLEEAARSLRLRDAWLEARPSGPGAFRVVIASRLLLEMAPPEMGLGELPLHWFGQGLGCRVFCRGWLHSFGALEAEGAREDLLGMCRWRGMVLELGCDQGLMARACRSRGFECTWVGVDYNMEALAKAGRHVDLAICADLTQGLPLAGTSLFDRIVCADFLEHLPYPWQALAQLRRCVKEDGLLVASFPNVGHWTVVADLLAGRFDPTPSGILCVTHLRFGTRRNWEKWLRDSGWEPVRWEYDRFAPPGAWDESLLGPLADIDRDSLSILRFKVVAQPV